MLHYEVDYHQVEVAIIRKKDISFLVKQENIPFHVPNQNLSWSNIPREFMEEQDLNALLSTLTSSFRDRFIRQIIWISRNDGVIQFRRKISDYVDVRTKW